MTSDQYVIATDQGAAPLQIRADIARVIRSRGIEIANCQLHGYFIDQGPVMLTAGSEFGTDI